MAFKLNPAALQSTITAFAGATVPDAWIQVNRSLVFNEQRPTALIVGSALEFDGASRQLAARGSLTDICRRLAEILGRQGCNLVNGACPGLPDEVMTAFCAIKERGLAVGLSAYPSPIEHLASKAFAPAGFPLSADVTVFCGSGFELLNVYNTLCADILIVVGGGVGTLLEVAAAVEQELPVICLSPSGGVARDIEQILRRFIAEFKGFKVSTVEDLTQVEELLSSFAAEFRSSQCVSRLTPLIRNVCEQVDSAAQGVTITLVPDEDTVTYQTGDVRVEMHRPLVLTDKARLARVPSRGEAIITALDEHPRTYVVDNVSATLSPQQQKIVWGPSIDSLMLLKAVSSSPLPQARRALEIGSGCGLLALWLVGTGKAETALGVDTDPAAVLTALWNAARLNLGDRCKFERRPFTSLEREEFDLIVCNPPYLPVPHHRRASASAYAGTALLNEFLRDHRGYLSENGNAYLVVSSASYLDCGVAKALSDLTSDGRARMVGRRDAPLKVGTVLKDDEWISMLLAGNGITERDADDYRYWHNLELWHLSSAAQLLPSPDRLAHAVLF